MPADRLILRGAEGYDQARFAHIFNARRPECYPAAVLHAEPEDDVVDDVRIARDRGWKAAIGAGGHSFPAWSLRDDALVIDLGDFKEISLDETQREVKTLTDDAWARLQQIRAERDPSGLFVDYLAGPGAFATATAGRRTDD